MTCPAHKFKYSHTDNVAFLKKKKKCTHQPANVVSTASQLPSPATWTWPNTLWTDRCAPCSWKAVSNSNSLSSTILSYCVDGHYHHHLPQYHHHHSTIIIFVSITLTTKGLRLARSTHNSEKRIVLWCVSIQGATTCRMLFFSGPEGMIQSRVWTHCGWLSIAWRATTHLCRRLCTRLVRLLHYTWELFYISKGFMCVYIYMCVCHHSQDTTPS